MIWKLPELQRWSKGWSVSRSPTNPANLISCPGGVGRIGSILSFRRGVNGGTYVESSEARVGAVHRAISRQFYWLAARDRGADFGAAGLDHTGVDSRYDCAPVACKHAFRSTTGALGFSFVGGMVPVAEPNAAGGAGNRVVGHCRGDSDWRGCCGS